MDAAGIREVFAGAGVLGAVVIVIRLVIQYSGYWDKLVQANVAETARMQTKVEQLEKEVDTLQRERNDLVIQVAVLEAQLTRDPRARTRQDDPEKFWAVDREGRPVDRRGTGRPYPPPPLPPNPTGGTVERRA